MGESSKNESWVGFDLGGTKMLAIVFDSNFSVVTRKRDRKSTRLNSSHPSKSRMPSSA
jgi:hypothetical protein